MGKKAIVFPGIGYHKDKPLLYYARDLAWEEGYQIECADFSGLVWEKKDLKDTERMKELFAGAMEKIRSDVEIAPEDELLFISKSIGTLVAASFARERGLSAKQIYFSPLVPLGMIAEDGGIAFYGDKDPLADAEEIGRICVEKKIEAYRIAGGDHSLETGNTEENLKNLSEIMRLVRSFIKSEGRA